VSAGAHRVLETLVDAFPEEPHFWNHLGRHQIYVMKTDYDRAEAHLIRAVQLSSGRDAATHHHTLGLVRRFWIEEHVRALARDRLADSPDVILAKVERLAALAAEEFEIARTIDPQDEYSYVTDIQMVLYIAEWLLRASGASDIAGVSTVSQPAADWLRNNFTRAEVLLERLRIRYVENEPSRYFRDCESALNQRYGNLDRVIEAWEAYLPIASDRVGLQRALARAYVARRERVWSAVSEQELRRIVELADDNLRLEPTSEQDIRLWFQAYRRLPEFTRTKALDRFGAWAARRDSVEAEYYLSILHFLAWQQSVEGPEQMLVHLDRCRVLARGGGRSWSYEWLGREPAWCPLVHFAELGQWDLDVRFYPRTKPLARTTGVIASMESPTSGRISLGERVTAYFRPAPRFWESKDVGALVDFYLGFSYYGLRAWDPDFAVTPAAADPAANPQAQPTTTSAAIVAAVSASSTASSGDDDLRSQALEFIGTLVDAAAANRRHLYLGEVGSKLRQRFPGRPVHERTGFSSVLDLIRSSVLFDVQDGPAAPEVVRRR
jgi:hypothetical protein